MRILITFLLLISTLSVIKPCYATEYYLYIEKVGKVDVGEEAGHNEKDDVVAICPLTPQYEPTSTELKLYNIIVVDLTEDERTELLQYDHIDTQGMTNDDTDDLVTKARKRKIDFDKLKVKKQKEKIEKSKFLSAVIVK